MSKFDVNGKYNSYVNDEEDFDDDKITNSKPSFNLSQHQIENAENFVEDKDDVKNDNKVRKQ